MLPSLTMPSPALAMVDILQSVALCLVALSQVGLVIGLTIIRRKN